MDPIRIECKKVAIKPTGAFLDTYTDVKLGVLFCHSTRDMYLCLNELKDKICIPYDQVYKALFILIFSKIDLFFPLGDWIQNCRIQRIRNLTHT